MGVITRRKIFLSEDKQTRLVFERETGRITIQKPTPKGNWMACDRYSTVPDRNGSMQGEQAWLVEA